MRPVETELDLGHAFPIYVEFTQMGIIDIASNVVYIPSLRMPQFIDQSYAPDAMLTIYIY